MEQQTRKQRINVDLPPEQVKWAEQAALKLSLERGKKISRNQLISEALELFKKHLEENN
jgi:biotin-(acetyl-CoA carboxylase) ligase